MVKDLSCNYLLLYLLSCYETITLADNIQIAIRIHFCFKLISFDNLANIAGSLLLS